MHMHCRIRMSMHTHTQIHHNIHTTRSKRLGAMIVLMIMIINLDLSYFLHTCFVTDSFIKRKVYEKAGGAKEIIRATE